MCEREHWTEQLVGICSNKWGDYPPPPLRLPQTQNAYKVKAAFGEKQNGSSVVGGGTRFIAVHYMQIEHPYFGVDSNFGDIVQNDEIMFYCIGQSYK